MLPKLAAVVHGQAVHLTSERQEIKLPQETLARYIGTYELAPRMNMMVTLDGEQLNSQLSGQRKFPLFAEAEGKFFLKVVDAQVEFVQDAGGKVTDAILHQGGRHTKARRTSDTVLERKEIIVKPEILAAYAGEYQAGQLLLAITVEGGRPMMQPSGQAKSELFAESETRFFLKIVDAQIEFVKNDDGVVTELTLRQGGIDLKAPRK